MHHLKPLWRFNLGSMLFTLSLMSVNGCGTKTGSDLVDGESQQIDSVYVVTEEPADAIPVGIAKESVEGEQYLSLVGTIGGSAKPFVDGIAAFTIVDPKVPSCAGEEGCPTPWDYCCTQNQVKDNIATVKIVDSEGVPVASDARGLLGVKELSTVVVSGTVKRDDTGNLSIAATQVFVKPSK